jgi:hypothetical protein
MDIAVGVGAMPGAELIAASGLNQGLVRFGDDRRTDAVIAAINATGETFFGASPGRGGGRCGSAPATGARRRPTSPARSRRSEG